MKIVQRFYTRDPVRIAQELIAAVESDADRLADLIDKICADGLWRERSGPKGTPFEDLARFVVAPAPNGLGVQTDGALRRLRTALLAKRLYREWIEVMEGRLRARGRPKKNVANSENLPPWFKRSRSSTAVDQVLPRLLREHPDLFKEVEAGTLTVRQAAIRAGIVPEPARTKRLRFGAVDLDAISRLKPKAQQRLLSAVFDAVGVDAQTALISLRLEARLGLSIAQKWRARVTKECEQPQT